MSAAGDAGGRRRPKDSPEVRLSKALSYVLRHGAVKEKVPIRPDGFVLVKDLLKNNRFKGSTLAEIRALVAADNKQRYTLAAAAEVDGSAAGAVADDDAAGWYVRANQGHSLAAVSALELAPIACAEECPTAVHGTSRAAWAGIQQTGLSRMRRHHIHLAAGLPGSEGVISGMRTSSAVYIYVDVAAAMRDGVVFFRSANNVILTEGVDGVLPPQYFARVLDAHGNSL
ncbi:phosphotransferase KptA/Tpt1, partial [Dipodascopsis tothii]|uniref:phosphotransferase KptA/Tpt1 n=1 Tax=Dipodascopsis tothii TaxID=44089 RepID=UPI0034CD8E02